MRPASRRSDIARASRSAFTLLEVVLASVLGLMMLLVCLSLFAAMDRSQRRLAKRADDAMEMATAHGALSRAFSNLLMTDQGDPGEEKLDQAKKDDVKTNAPDRVNQIESGAERARFAIQPSKDAARMGDARTQTVYIALRTPPVYGGEAVLTDEFVSAQDRREKKRSIFSKDSKDDRSGQSSGGNAGSAEDSKLNAAMKMLQGLAPTQVGDAGQADGESNAIGGATVEPAKSIGVRGIFELLPSEPDPKNRGSGSDDPGWTLWWRETPPEAPLPPPGARYSKADAAAFGAQSEPKRAALLRNLRAAKWSVYRDGEFGPKINAVYAAHLPAYVQFQFETMDGRREDWVFEVGWGTGPEPGSLIPASRDQLNTQQDGKELPPPDPGQGNPTP